MHQQPDAGPPNTNQAPDSPSRLNTRKTSLDIIGNYIRRAEKSKTRRVMNLLYSLGFGYFSTHYMPSNFKYRQIVGILLAVLAYLISTRIFSKN